MLTDGRTVEVGTVVWATGFTADFGWIALPVLDAAGRLRHRRGDVVGAPGVYVLGQRFQITLASHLVGGVGDDARRIVDRIRAGSRSSSPSAVDGPASNARS